ncbi:MAG: pyridoxine 5'-phosphate synthase [Candidatus Omnitrophica bacterium]|nr:pyridoxine 5'-phosphate synthase [Candidatus Omnitrophota bacterium]MDD5610406.1 pyridoxine 5'-phosphate synthase [Candidatus Omnitrophota bacterium]
MPKLGVNIDHTASLRQLRNGIEPEIISCAILCESAGCDSIVVHLREDQRHIQEKDVYLLKKAVKTKLNLEMATSKKIIEVACLAKPHQATLVPEKRQEVTTEGGLDVLKNAQKVADAVSRLKGAGIEVSLFIDPQRKQIEAASKLVGMIELHTGRYANASLASRNKYLDELVDAVHYAKDLGLIVNAGHGLDYDNVVPVATIEGIEELNIGYSIICQSVFTGLGRAVKKMKELVS